MQQPQDEHGLGSSGPQPGFSLGLHRSLSDMDVLHLPRGEDLKRLFGEYVVLGKVYDLGQPLQRGMPLSPLNPPFFFTLSNRHGDRVTSQGVSAANDLISMGSHQGTHIDALGHISKNGTLHGGAAGF